MYFTLRKILIFTLVFGITYSNFIDNILLAQETVSSLKMEIDSLKNQILKLQSDVYTTEQSSDDPECSSVTMMLANIEGEILGAEQKKKQAEKDVVKKREEKKKLQEEIANYERMYANATEKAIIYGMVAAAGIAGMVALGISNKKIKDKLDKGEYTGDGARCLQGSGQVDYNNLGKWKNACQTCCLKAKENNRESCKNSCASAEQDVKQDIERQVANANVSYEELKQNREIQKNQSDELFKNLDGAFNIK